MAKTACSVDGCEGGGPIRLDMCTKHYSAVRRHGTASPPPRRYPTKPVEERFWSKVDKTETCWLWTGSRDAAGYGRVRFDGRLWGAHRVSHMLFLGPIPDGLEVGHLCAVRACVRPDHLQAMTHAENHAMVPLSAFSHPKDVCKYGHPLEGENVRITANGRKCVLCARRRGREQYAKHRERYVQQARDRRRQAKAS